MYRLLLWGDLVTIALLIESSNITSWILGTLIRLSYCSTPRALTMHHHCATAVFGSLDHRDRSRSHSAIQVCVDVLVVGIPV